MLTRKRSNSLKTLKSEQFIIWHTIIKEQDEKCDLKIKQENHLLLNMRSRINLRTCRRNLLTPNKSEVSLLLLNFFRLSSTADVIFGYKVFIICWESEGCWCSFKKYIFSEKFAGNSHTLTQKWGTQGPYKRSSSCVKHKNGNQYTTWSISFVSLLLKSPHFHCKVPFFIVIKKLSDIKNWRFFGPFFNVSAYVKIIQPFLPFFVMVNFNPIFFQTNNKRLG